MQAGAGGDLTPAAAAAAAAALSPTTPGPTQPAARPTAVGASSGGTPSVSHRGGSNNRQHHSKAAAAAQQAVNAALEVKDVLQSGSRLKGRAAGGDANKSKGRGAQLVALGPRHGSVSAAAADGWDGAAAAKQAARAVAEVTANPGPRPKALGSSTAEARVIQLNRRQLKRDGADSSASCCSFCCCWCCWC